MDKSSCLVIAGEKSGEEHFLSFFDGILANCPDTHFYGVGGDQMSDKGVELLYHLNEFSSWGFSEVIGKIPCYYNALNKVASEVAKRKTKTAILVDFQTFNLKLAVRLKKLGVKVLYYVAPQAWAWKEFRVKALSESVHTLFSIIPFEKKWFGQRGVNSVISVPHPLYHTYSKYWQNIDDRQFGGFFKNKKINILILPGSRNFEARLLLPRFFDAISEIKKNWDVCVSTVKSPSISETFFDYYGDQIDIFHESTNISEALLGADFAFAASGTVTLACALFGVPTVVCYKGSLLEQFAYDNFISYRGPISLANIVNDKLLFPEFIQDSVNTYNLIKFFNAICTDEIAYEKMTKELTMTRNRLVGDDRDIAEYMASIIKEN